MKKVTRNNLVRFVNMKKKYEETKDKELLKEINSFVEEAINKDKHYFDKLTKYDFTSDQLKYLLF